MVEAQEARSDVAVRLRKVSTEDLERFTRWMEDAEVRRHFSGRAQSASPTPLLPAPGSRPAANVARAIESYDGRLLGWVELRDVNWRRRSGELRICLGERDTWGCGYGSAALQLFLDLAFNEWHMTSIHLRVATWNERAIRSYERCGFRRTGRLRAGGRERDGLQDLWLMTATAPADTRRAAGLA